MFLFQYEHIYLTYESIPFIMGSRGDDMDIPTKIRLAETYAKISEAELARRLGTTSQAFGQRMKTGKFNSAELGQIAEALGAKFTFSFRFPDGTEI